MIALGLRTFLADSTPANDDLDALLADLPMEFPDEPALQAVTDLTPDDPDFAEAQAVMARRTAEAVTADRAEPVAPVRDLVKTPAPRRARRSQRRDREDVRSFKGFATLDEARVAGSAAPEVVAKITPPSTSPSSTLNPTPATPSDTSPCTPLSEDRRRRRPAGPKARGASAASPSSTPSRQRLPASWTEAREETKGLFYNRALDRFGVPFAFSLNLDPKVIAAANDNPRGFLDHVRRRVDRELKAILRRSVAFWLAVETDDDGRPHLHGGIATNDNERPAVEEALRRAGGGWTRQGSAPADTRLQWRPDGWATYPWKRVGRTRKHLAKMSHRQKSKITMLSASADLRDEAKRLHAKERARLRSGSVTADSSASPSITCALPNHPVLPQH